MKSKGLIASLAAVIIAGTPLYGAETITLGTINLAAETAGQQVAVDVSGTDQTAGMDLYFVVGGGTTGPTITNVDMTTGTIWGGTAFQTEIPGGNSRTSLWSCVTASGTVLANGKIATVTFDTTGIAPGSYPISLSFMGYGSAFADEYGGELSTTLFDGTLVVPGATYTVTYSGNENTGGTAPVDGSSPYASGATVTVLGAGSLVRTGHTFAGWNTAADGSGTSRAPASTFAMPASNVTHHAQWTINQHTVTFQTDGTPGASLTGNTSQLVDYGSSCTAVTANAPVGWHFVKWTRSGADYSTNATITVSNVTSNMTLVANYAIDTYTVTYSGNENTGGTAPVDGSSPYAVGATVTVLGAGDLVRTGYAFAGWNTAADGSGTSRAPASTFAMPAANVTLYAQWTINQYTVTFLTDGTVGSGLLGDGVQTVDYLGACTPVTAVAPANHHLVNWTVGGIEYATANPVTVDAVAADMTLTANFALDSHVVSFSTDGTPGSYIIGTTPQTVAHGGTCSAVMAIAPANWHLVNWTGTGGFVTTASNPLAVSGVTASMDITANYAPDTYTVTYSGNENTGGTVPVDGSSPYAVGATVTVLGAGDLVRTGYTFAGWNTAANGSGTTQAPASTFAMPAANVTLYAQWTLNQYTVTFLTDGTIGSGLLGDGVQTVDHLGSCTPVTAVVPDGFGFVNWTEEGIEYATANPVTVAAVAADMTLVANYAPAYVLTVASGSGSGSYAAGTQVAITADAAAPNYVFDAWTGDIGTVSDPSDPTTFLTMPAASIAVAATYRVSVEGDFQVVAEAQTGGTVNGLGLYEETVEAGESVVLTAAAEPGAEWTGWTGDHVGMDNPLTLTVFGDIDLVATFEIVEGVTIGSASVVSATEFGRGDEFAASPKVWGVAFDPVKDPLQLKPKKLGLKGLTKIPKGAPQPSARYEHTKKVRLVDMKALKAAWKTGTTTAAWLAGDVTRQKALPVRLIGQGKDAVGKYMGEIRWVEMSLAEITALRNVADDADVNTVAPLGQVLVKGDWIGAKAPKAWIEYIDPVKGGVKQWKLKVVKPLRFANAAGKPASSCMNPDTGASEVLLLAPKTAPKGLVLPVMCVLVLDNGIGFATVPVQVVGAGD
jgi:uncharacterized repeat protein (TIGR02543 family)